MEEEAVGTEVKYISTIDNPSEDKRQYRGLILQNQLQVLLISDPETDKSAASLSVGVGHLSDPDDIPGLAHLCEHMLFMGSKKYPCENEFDKFLAEHGGHSNASTSTDKTLYFFEVASEHFGGALDRFVHLFLSPLMTESAVESEVCKIDLQYSSNFSNDNKRFVQLIKSFSKDDHPYRKFGTGNKMTLFTSPQERGIDLREELLNFHEKWYSANIMVLVVLGKESLDDLEEMVAPLFSEVANKNVVRPEWTDHPFGPDQVRTKIYAVPVEDLKELKISFPIPDLRKHYTIKPDTYLSDLVGHEGPGSLLAALKAEGWANGLQADPEHEAKGFDFFSICIDLTNNGIEKIDEIITLVFQYLSMLKTSGVEEWIFDECKKISDIDFRYRCQKNPIDFVKEIGEYFQINEYPLEKILVGHFLVEEWKPDLIKMLLSDYLIPSNVMVLVIGKKFDSIADEVEQWYGTKYKLEKIPEDDIRKWENIDVNDALKLPVPNEFIPSNFEIVFHGEEDIERRHPEVIYDKDFLRVWLREGREFLLPKADICCEFVSPLDHRDPLSCSSMYIFIELLKDSLDEYTYYAKLAGLSYSIRMTEYGFVLNVNGFSEKQNILLDKILERMTADFEMDAQRFDALKEMCINKFESFKAQEPFEQVKHYLPCLLLEKAWMKEEIAEAAKQLTFENLKEFIRGLLSQLYVECFMHGNIDKERANSLIQIMKDRLLPKLSNKPLLREELSRYREIKLKNRENIVKEFPNEFHEISCIDNYYQCCQLSTENNTLMDLLHQITEERSRDTLETKEQLGEVKNSILKFNSVQGLRIVVQSDRDTDFVDQRIEAFLTQLREDIANMSDEEFERNKETLATKRLQKSNRLSVLSSKFLYEIRTRQYNFDRDEIEVGYLQTVSKNELVKFFDEYIKRDAPRRRKLSVHVISQSERGSHETDSGFSSPVDDEVDCLAEKIEDVNKFKSCHELYPLADPFVDIEEFKHPES